MGWTPKWDIRLFRSSSKLQPRYSRVPNWRVFTALDRLDMKTGDLWNVGVVVDVDPASGRVKVKKAAAAATANSGESWVDIMR